MNYISFHARQSGRTTRMLEEAILSHQVDRRAVYILSPDENIKQETKRLAMRLCHQKGIELPSSIKFETVESLGFNNIDWKEKKLHNAHPNCKLFIDHHVYAKYFDFAIEGFHKYDNAWITHPEQIKSL